MKAKYAFEIMDLDGERVAVPVGDGAEQFHGVLKMNETASDILKLLEKDTTEDQIIIDLLKEYEGDPDEMRKYVHSYIEQLIAEGVVE